MSDVFVVRNQLGHYWGKAQAWEDGTTPKAVMRFKHEDEAINTLFELSSKDFELRGEILSVPLSSKGEPVVEPSEHLLPKAPKNAHDAAEDADTDEAPPGDRNIEAQNASGDAPDTTAAAAPATTDDSAVETNTALES